MTTKTETATPYGFCPVCGASPRIRVTNDGLWAYCNVHRKKWQLACADRPNNCYESQSEREDNADYLSHFDVAAPIFSPADRVGGKDSSEPAQNCEGVWRSTRGLLRVVNGGGEHFVMYTPYFVDGSQAVVFGPLDSREAALIAFHDLIEHVLEHGPLKDDARFSLGLWNKAALIARFLRNHEGFPPEEIGRGLLEHLDRVVDQVDWLYSRESPALDHEDPLTSQDDCPL